MPLPSARSTVAGDAVCIFRAEAIRPSSKIANRSKPHRERLGELAPAVVLLLDRGGVAEHAPVVKAGNSAW